MKILIAYPGHGFSTIDVANGYKKALKDLGHDVWAFNYHESLSFYMAALDRWEELNPGLERLNDDFGVLASERLFIETFDYVPDVVLIVFGLALHRRVYDMLTKLGVPKVLLLTESPYDDYNQAPIIEKGGIAATFTNDRASVKPLRKTTGGKVKYLPHSWNPGTHFPRGRPNDKYLSDVFFFGTLWPERKELFGHLGKFCKDGTYTERLVSSNGYNANIAGIQPVRRGKLKGFIENGELAWYYAGTKIAINHNRTVIGEDDDGKLLHVKKRQAWSLGPRPYEIAACGTFQLSTPDRPELRKVFGRTVPTYKNGKDLRKKIAYYLEHDDERRELARSARDKVKHCRFEDRAKEILIPTITEVI